MEGGGEERMRGRRQEGGGSGGRGRERGEGGGGEGRKRGRWGGGRRERSLTCNAQWAMKTASEENPRHQTTSERSDVTTHVGKEFRKEMKMNESGINKSERLTSWQSPKHVRLYSEQARD